MKSSIIACLCSILISTCNALAQGWRGIVPLHSTRSDVERLTGPPMQADGIVYDLADERVNIYYSTDACEKGYPYGWNIPPGTVINIKIYPKSKHMLSELHLDLSKFKEFSPYGLPIYSDDAQGFRVETGPEGEVISVEYYPPAGNNHLLCPDAAARLSKVVEGATYPDPLLIYHGASVAGVRAQLNSLGKILQSEADSRAFVIVYAGQRAYDGEAKRHAMRVKNYLIKRFEIKPGRIMGVDGGFREEFTAELYIISGNMSEPLASPTIRPSKVQIVKRNK